MGFELSEADERKLVGLRPELVGVVRELARTAPVKFRVVEGLRTEERQRELFAEKKTKTLKSKHLDGRAVDIAPIVSGKVSWEWKHFTPLIKTAKAIALARGVPMVFGYDWGWDAPHLELR